MTPTFAHLPFAVLAQVDAWLGLDRLSLADPETSLDWAHPLPAWAWVAVILAAIGFGTWSYVHLQGAVWMRSVLAGLRVLTLLLIAVLLAGPELTRTDERVEPDWVLMLVDRSASMQIEDVADTDADARRVAVSRDEQLRRTLSRHAELLSRAMGEDREVRWLGFEQDARTIVSPYPAPSDADDTVPAAGGAARDFEADELDLPPAVGRQTYLRTALDRALDLAQGRPLSGVVVFSDGQTPETIGPDLTRRLSSRLAGVYAVPLGARVPPRDLSIAGVDTPREAFVDDVVPVAVSVDIAGGGEAGRSLDGVRVRLIDPRNTDPDTNEPRVLDEKTLGDVPPGEVVRLSAPAQTIGELPWRVELLDADGDRGELLTSNNVADIDTRVINRALRVLYVSAYPRWEFRYLKNLLIREESVEVSTMLLSADRDFAQEGNRPISRLPRTREELSGYDAVILGDVPVDSLGFDRLEHLQKLVAEEGMGLVWIGGMAAMPREYAGTVMSSLLPMRDPASVSEVPVPPGGAVVQAASLADSLNVMQIRDSGGELLSLADLAELYWLQDVGPLKPAAEVLAFARPAGPASGSASAETANAESDASWPVALRMRFGAGQVLYLATDETWRWRYGRGSVVFEQFWIQLIRLLARGQVDLSEAATSLSVSNRRVDLGQSLVIEMVSRDPALMAQDKPTLDAVVVDADDPQRQVARITLRRETDPAAASESGRVRYRAVWQPTEVGPLAIRLDETGVASSARSRTVRVRPTDPESRNLETDHAKLASLAEATGGAVVPAEELGRLAELIPSRPRRTPFEIRESLWDSWVALIMMLAFLTMEWAGRKLIRLV